MRVLVIEDGEEYTRTLTRFCADVFDFTRAGDGAEALALLSGAFDGTADPGPFDRVFLDMRFDRVSPASLLGDIATTAERFNGDPNRARQFLEDNQGAYILAALRAAGHELPVVFSHDFDAEPKRWASMARMYAPVRYLPDNASADTIRAALLGL